LTERLLSPSPERRVPSAPGYRPSLAPIGLPDEFLAVGALPTLHDRYGLSTDEVAARVKLELGATAHGHGPWAADDEPATA
jgi:transketolase